MDSDPIPGTDIHLKKMATVTIEDLSPDRNLNPSQCNVTMFCTAQCTHWVWNPNTIQYLNLCTAKKSHSTNSLAYIKGSFILERKRTRKRHRFQPVALFPICVFILQRQQWRQTSKKKSLSRSLSL